MIGFEASVQPAAGGCQEHRARPGVRCRYENDDAAPLLGRLRARRFRLLRASATATGGGANANARPPSSTKAPAAKTSEQERRKGIPDREEEHTPVLLGLTKFRQGRLALHLAQLCGLALHHGWRAPRAKVLHPAQLHEQEGQAAGAPRHHSVAGAGVERRGRRRKQPRTAATKTPARTRRKTGAQRYGRKCVAKAPMMPSYAQQSHVNGDYFSSPFSKRRARFFYD